jgi:hypothetical protein
MEMNKQKDALKENKQLKINVCVVCMHCALQEGNNECYKLQGVKHKHLIMVPLLQTLNPNT